jgi:glycosyltransferase involved in cell wall biosynthesis
MSAPAPHSRLRRESAAPRRSPETGVQPTATSVLFLSPEPLAASPTGPARRTVKLAEAAAERCKVTLAAPAPSVFPDGPFRTLETGPPDDQRLAGAARSHDVVVVQTLPSPRQLFAVRRHARVLVVDLIAPVALEMMEVRDDPGRRATVRWRAREMVAHMAAADLVICSNERQRDLATGAGMAAGLLDPESPAPFHERVVVVPHGLDPEPARGGASSLRSGALADPGCRIAIWGGGIWSWLDPLTAVKAVERLRPARPDLKLAFVGLDHPDPAPRLAHAALREEAVEYVRDSGLEDTVVFRPQWLGREEFVHHLADADVGVSLNGPTLEARYATRTRVLDYLSVGLPVVCTRGDTMADVIDSHGLGGVVAPLDVDGCAAALDRLTGPGAARLDATDALEPLLWRNVARPLVEFCAHPRPAGVRASPVLAARTYPAFLRAVHRSGSDRGLTQAVLRRARGALRGGR